jgi:pimeloyl-ACP methyl ester carboxylesterase
VSDLELYHEVHGAGRPLVLLHGAMSTVETSFEFVLPEFARTRRVIAIEQQAHGRTPDVDRPLSYAQMADDTAALLGRLGIDNADFYGYSMGSGIAVELALRHPGLVGKLALASLATSKAGFHPEIVEAIEGVTAADLAGSVFESAYKKVAPDPSNWPTLVAKCNQLDIDFDGWSDEEIRSIDRPVLLIIGTRTLSGLSTPWSSSGSQAEVSRARAPAYPAPSSPSSPAPATSQSSTERTGWSR